MIVSLLASPHNLHAYDEMSMAHTQVPLGVSGGDLAGRLPEVYGAIADLLDDPEHKILVHLEEFGDRLSNGSTCGSPRPGTARTRHSASTYRCSRC